MVLKLNGRKYRYSPAYFKHEDNFNVRPPKYSIHRYGQVLYENEWKKCHFHIVKIGSNPVLYVSPGGSVKEGMSELGPVDNQGFLDIIYISRPVLAKINLYDYLFNIQIKLLNLTDWAKRIKKNLWRIFWAALGSVIYFFINHYFDGYLQELINQSNFIQSLIVFLSLSSLINIIYPFSLRKELSIEEVDELIRKHKKDLVENFDDYKDKWRSRTKF